MIETMGWVGNLLLAVCGAPQAWRTFRLRNNTHCVTYRKGSDLSLGFLLLWLGGELCAGVYAAFALGWDLPILTNIGANVFFISVILWYR